jgi:hypothetical protein
MAFAKRYCRKTGEVDLAKIIVDFIQQPKHQQHGIRLIRDSIKIRKRIRQSICEYLTKNT